MDQICDFAERSTVKSYDGASKLTPNRRPLLLEHRHLQSFEALA